MGIVVIYKFKYKNIGDKVKVTLQKTVKLHGMPWRIGSSRTVKKGEVIKAENELIDFIIKHNSLTLYELIDLYPNQYEKILDNPAKIQSGDVVMVLSRALQMYTKSLIDNSDYTGSAVKNRTYSLKQTISRLGIENLDVRMITPQLIEKSLAQYESTGVKKGTVHLLSSSWRLFLSWMRVNKYITGNPHELVSYDLKKPRKSPSVKVYSTYQLDQLYSELQKLDTPSARALMVMIDTGMRAGEVVALTKFNLIGAFITGKPLNKSGELYDNLNKVYYQLVKTPKYTTILASITPDVTISGDFIATIYPEINDLSTYERRLLVNTTRFLYYFKGADNYDDFKWKTVVNVKVKSSRDSTTHSPSDFYNSPGNLSWLTDFIENYEALVTINSTQHAIINTDGTIKRGFKDGAKTPKGTRSIPLNQRSRDTLTLNFNKLMQNDAMYKQYLKTGHLFVNESGAFVNSGKLNNTIAKVVKSLKAKGIAINYLPSHSLRHSWATNHAKNISEIGSFHTLQKLLGHENLTTTLDTYVHGDEVTLSHSSSDL